MARVNIPVTKTSDAGVADPAPTAADPVNGNALPNTGKTILRVTNTDGAAAHQLTLGTPVKFAGKDVADTVVSIPANATRTFGALPTGLYGTSVPIDADDAQITFLAFEA